MRNIRTRLFFTFLVLILFTSTLMGSLFYFLTREHLLKSKEENLSKSAEAFIKFITPFAEKEMDLGPTTKFFIRQSWAELDYRLQVIDTRGEIISDSRGASHAAGKGDKRFLRALDGRSELWIEKTPEGQVMCKCVPIKLDARIIGAARLSISLVELEELLSVMKKYFVLTFLLSLLAAIGLSLFFIRTLMKPVTRIRDTAARIARGDLDSRVNYDSPDELGDLSRTINFMSLELKKLEQARAEFLGNVSHELKTPLTIIKGFVITLLSTPGLSSEWTRPLELINRETDRLTRLVEELLELTRLRSGRVILRFSKCDLAEILKSIETQMTPKAAASGVSISLACPDDLPKLWADSDRIKEIFINLIDNALKYGVSSEGKVSVTVRAVNDDVEVDIRDNGPGIPENDVPFVFERFFRGGSKKVDGTGLGLAIVKEIVDAHNGKICVESKEGDGTLFTVTLPIKVPDEAG